MWGRGIYFAVNCSYSKKNYKYTNDSDGTHSLFYARVALGESIELPADRALRMPPAKPSSNGSKARYHSVKGNTENGGVKSDVYIVYDNCRAYPEYLITFKA